MIITIEKYCVIKKNNDTRYRALPRVGREETFIIRVYIRVGTESRHPRHALWDARMERAG